MNEATILERVNDLKCHPGLHKPRELEDLKNELTEFKMGDLRDVPTYEGEQADGTVIANDEFDAKLLHYHFQHRNERPQMWKVALIVSLAQPSSAAVERVFSTYRRPWAKNQMRTLFDKKKLAVKLNWNNRVDSRPKREYEMFTAIRGNRQETTEADTNNESEEDDEDFSQDEGDHGTYEEPLVIE